MTVWCHACARVLDVPDAVLDQITAQADVTCPACYQAGQARVEREAARWARWPIAGAGLVIVATGAP